MVFLLRGMGGTIQDIRKVGRRLDVRGYRLWGYLNSCLLYESYEQRVRSDPSLDLSQH